MEHIQPHVAPPPGYLAFMVSHPSFAKGNLIAAVATSEELSSWIDVLEKSSRVTWDSAILGDQLITELRDKGSQMLKKKNSLLQKRIEDEAEARRLKVAQEKAEEEIKQLSQEREVRQKDAEEIAAKEAAARAEREAVEKELLKMKEKTSALEGERSKLEGKASRARLQAEEVTKKLEATRSKAQLALEAAENAQQMLQEEERKARQTLKQREKELKKAAESRDKMLADIERERERRLKAENMLTEAEESLNNLDRMLRKHKKDVGIGVDLKNIRSVFEGRKPDPSPERTKNPIADELAALRVGDSDAKRQAMREAAAAKRREQKQAALNSGGSSDTPAAPQASKSAAIPETSLENVKDEASGTNDAVSAFESEEVRALEINDDEEDESDGSSGEDEEYDQELIERGTQLFRNIDTNGNGVLLKAEFFDALEHGALEMTDEIKE